MGEVPCCEVHQDWRVGTRLIVGGLQSSHMRRALASFFVLTYDFYMQLISSNCVVGVAGPATLSGQKWKQIARMP